MLKSHMMKNIVLACCFLDINFYETCPGTDKTCQGLNFLNSGTGIRSLQFLATHVTSYVSRISCLTARLQENVDYKYGDMPTTLIQHIYYSSTGFMIQGDARSYRVWRSKRTKDIPGEKGY